MAGHKREFHPDYLTYLPPQEARENWLTVLAAAGFFRELPIETIPVTAALGRITAEAILARCSVPHYNSAAMDGIAVRAADTREASDSLPLALKPLAADEVFQSGGCYLVDTGDALPPGTDAVIMVEEIHDAGESIEITLPAFSWQHVRLLGEDMAERELIVPAYHVIRPADMAAILAGGWETIDVVRRPVVTVIPTGSELVDSPQALAPGRILDVNSHMLCAALSEWGAAPVRHAIVPDDREQLAAAIKAALADSDIVITNAGTSTGTEDFTAAVLGELGQVVTHGVAMKPGRPVILAVCQEKPVIGLPGYPVSAMLTAECFVRELVYRRQGQTPPPLIEDAAVLARPLASHVGTEEHVRVALGRVNGRLIAVPQGRGAGVISSLVRSHGIVTVPAASTGLKAGSQVTVRLKAASAVGDILVVGSHDPALDLVAAALFEQYGLRMSCAPAGSMGGLLAVRNHEADAAGIHLLDFSSGTYNVPFVEQYWNGASWQLLHFARREQGLLVAPGNPLGLQCVADLAQPGVRFINRQRGAGTRLLLDYHLQQAGLSSALLDGYTKEVGTHMAVAATIAGGAADAGLGIRAAAQALGLDFISLAQEDYALLLNMPPEDARSQALQQTLQTPALQQAIAAMGGYDAAAAGRLVWQSAAVQRKGD